MRRGCPQGPADTPAPGDGKTYRKHRPRSAVLRRSAIPSVRGRHAIVDGPTIGPRGGLSLLATTVHAGPPRNSAQPRRKLGQPHFSLASTTAPRLPRRGGPRPSIWSAGQPHLRQDRASAKRLNRCASLGPPACVCIARASWATTSVRTASSMLRLADVEPPGAPSAAGTGTIGCSGTGGRRSGCGARPGISSGPGRAGRLWVEYLRLDPEQGPRCRPRRRLIAPCPGKSGNQRVPVCVRDQPGRAFVALGPAPRRCFSATVLLGIVGEVRMHVVVLCEQTRPARPIAAGGHTRTPAMVQKLSAPARFSAPVSRHSRGNSGLARRIANRHCSATASPESALDSG